MNNFPGKIKKIIKLVLKREYPFKVQEKIPKTWLGNQYGGFFVATQFVNNKSVVLSFGIGEDISFDMEICSMAKCTHGFDPTPKSIKWIKGNMTRLPENFAFHEYGIHTDNGFVNFFLPKNENFISGSIIKKSQLQENGIRVPVKCFREICSELNLKFIDVLKMDIEGAEYDVIPDIISSGIKVKQILIEFHHRFIPDGFEKNSGIISLMNEAGYKIFGVSDSLEEVSFINTGY